MNLDTIVVAAISLLGTLAGSYFANSKTIALLSYRLEQLERKVEKHNSVVERTFQLENNVQTAFSRIDEIREAAARASRGMKKKPGLRWREKSSAAVPALFMMWFLSTGVSHLFRNYSVILKLRCNFRLCWTVILDNAIMQVG